eukprot:scaffold144082_cov31-Prasinocladus_malaysianus.AAC.1
MHRNHASEYLVNPCIAGITHHLKQTKRKQLYHSYAQHLCSHAIAIMIIIARIFNYSLRQRVGAFAS